MAPGATLAGERLVGQKCVACHGLDVALGGARSESEWAAVLDRMVGHGMEASPEELRLMQTYLATRKK